MTKKKIQIYDYTVLSDSVLQEVASIADDRMMFNSGNQMILSMFGKSREVFGAIMARRIMDFPKDRINVVVDSCDPIRNWRNKKCDRVARFSLNPSSFIQLDIITFSMVARWFFSKIQNSKTPPATFISFDSFDFQDVKDFLISDFSAFGEVIFNQGKTVLVDDGNKSFDHSKDSQWENDIIAKAVRNTVSSLDI